MWVNYEIVILPNQKRSAESQQYLKFPQSFNYDIKKIEWPLHKKWTFPLRISSVNLTKSAAQNTGHI